MGKAPSLIEETLLGDPYLKYVEIIDRVERLFSWTAAVTLAANYSTQEGSRIVTNTKMAHAGARPGATILRNQKSNGETFRQTGGPWGSCDVTPPSWPWTHT